MTPCDLENWVSHEKLINSRLCSWSPHLRIWKPDADADRQTRPKTIVTVLPLWAEATNKIICRYFSLLFANSHHLCQFMQTRFGTCRCYLQCFTCLLETKWIKWESAVCHNFMYWYLKNSSLHSFVHFPVNLQFWLF